MYQTAPTKYPNINPNQAVYHHSNLGPIFGSGFGLKICGDFLNETKSYSKIGNDYQDALGKGHSVFTGDVNNTNFKLKEMEIFKVIK